ncbi:MAG TPA: hypothetical protein VL137_15615 [Polyangiaceae bacterium]|nr:hypothetical protein [Polyangiaceae bacterium]
MMARGFNGRIGSFMVVAVASLVVACGGGRVMLDRSSNTVINAGTISVWADWIKDKGVKYDVRLNIQNDSEKSLIVKLGGTRCYRGQTEGELKHTFFNTGEKTMDFEPGQKKAFNLVCDLAGEARGDFRIVIERVFDNPSNDGMTPGVVVAEKVEWRLPEAIGSER